MWVLPGPLAGLGEGFGRHVYIFQMGHQEAVHYLRPRPSGEKLIVDEILDEARAHDATIARKTQLSQKVFEL